MQYSLEPAGGDGSPMRSRLVPTNPRKGRPTALGRETRASRIVALDSAAVPEAVEFTITCQKIPLFCNRVRIGGSGSPKVDNVGTNRKRVCDFLLVRHCNYGPILHPI